MAIKSKYKAGTIRYDDGTKAKAISMLEETGGDLRKVAHALDIPPDTLRDWRTKALHVEERQVKQWSALRQEAGAQFLEVTSLAAESLRIELLQLIEEQRNQGRRLNATELKAITVIWGVGGDKMHAFLKPEESTFVDQRTQVLNLGELSVPELKSMVKELRDIKQEFVAGADLSASE